MRGVTMVIAAKSIPSEEREEDDEVQLQDFRDWLTKEGCFAYAWTFNPDENALNALRENLPAWLYLVHRKRPGLSRLRMRIIDFRHDRALLHCLLEWRQYCIEDMWSLDMFPNWLPIHLWFLIDRLEKLTPPTDLSQFEPWFPDKYRDYGRNFFAFLRDCESC